MPAIRTFPSKISPLTTQSLCRREPPDVLLGRDSEVADHDEWRVGERGEEVARVLWGNSVDFKNLEPILGPVF